MKQLYNVFSDERVAPLVRQLSWSHCLILLPIKNYDEIKYYIEQCIKLNLSKRELEQKIKSREYQRLDNDAQNTPIIE